MSRIRGKGCPRLVVLANESLIDLLDESCPLTASELSFVHSKVYWSLSCFASLLKGTCEHPPEARFVWKSRLSEIARAKRLTNQPTD